MKTTGTVTEINGELATVETERQSACDGCHSKGFCLACTKKTMTVSARNDAGAVPGDRVELETPSGSVLGYAAFIFVFPIVFALAAYLISAALTAQAVLPYLVSLGVFIACFGVIGIVGRSERVKQKNRITVVSILQEEEE